MICRWSVGDLSVNCWLSVGRQLANSRWRWAVLHFHRFNSEIVTNRQPQGAKKITFTACQLKLAFTSADVISLAPKTFWLAELISQFSCYLNFSQNITRLSGKWKTEFTSPIAKSTNPGLSDTTFFTHCNLLNVFKLLESYFFSCHPKP